MSADGQQINLHLFGIDPEFTVPLYCIHVKNNARIEFVNQSTGFSNGLQRADLVIGMHNGHQNGISPDGTPQILQADYAVAVHRKVRNLKSLFFQVMHSLHNRRVFNTGGNDMASCSPVCKSSADQCQII